MKKPLQFCLILLISSWSSQSSAITQQNELDTTAHLIALVSDTQAPLGVEKIYLKSNNNTLATKKIFENIVQQKPTNLFILGDVVSIGSKEKKWKEMDGYLTNLRSQGTVVTALLGNHDVMLDTKKGENAFKKRFPDEVNTGFYKIIDSIGFVLLNSNFKKLSKEQLAAQDLFYANTLNQLDKDSTVKMVIVTCHHAPYSNSKIVGSNTNVQEKLIPLFIQSKKAKLFITGHAHDFEHFNIEGKDFLTIGGGGGIHQPLRKKEDRRIALSDGYEPEFHYLTVQRIKNELSITSRYLTTDFSEFKNGYHFIIK
ncbi:MAG: metallophosphoesterase [Sphingobacteriia bacterium]